MSQQWIYDLQYAPDSPIYQDEELCDDCGLPYDECKCLESKELESDL
jgi:hypothetical protein